MPHLGARRTRPITDITSEGNARRLRGGRGELRQGQAWMAIGQSMMTTTASDVHREQLLRLLEAGRSHAFLTAAEPYLAVAPDDHYVRLMAVREYLKLSLVGPAKELIEADAPESYRPPELQSVRDSLATIPGGSVPWSRHTARFERNLASLSRRGVDVELIRRRWDEEQALHELFEDRSGGYQVRMRDGTNPPRWIPYLGDHRAVDGARSLPDDVEEMMPGPYLFEGLELGWYFKRVHDATRDTFLGYGCALYVVEPDPAALALVLHLHDWSDLLADPRVFVFVGPSCTAQFKSTLEENVNLPWPTHVFTLSSFRPKCSPTCADIAGQGAADRQRQVLQSLDELERRYAARSAKYWANRYDEALSDRGKPLRILATVSRHTTFLQYSMRDAKRAFEALGHRFMLLKEANDHEVVGPLTYHQAIRDFDPDLFFVIDHIRPEFGPIVPANLPMMTWDQDALPGVFVEDKVKLMSPLDTVVGLPQDNCVARFGCDPRRFHVATLPTCPAQFDASDLEKDELTPYECDVSYVSHASQTDVEFHESELAGQKDANMQRLLNALYPIAREAMPPGSLKPTIGYREMIDCARGVAGIASLDVAQFDRLTGWYLWRLWDRRFRHEALAWVAQWAQRRSRSFRIYGRGWENHPVLAPFAAGPAQNGRELLCIYRASAINLQLMPAGFIHQRALDGLSAGGFFMSRATESDTRRRDLAPLLDRIKQRGLTSGAALLRCGDEVLVRAFLDYHGLHKMAGDQADVALCRVLQSERANYAAEVFPRFGEISFSSEASFSRAADRFLANPSLRQATADAMRQIVLNRYTYQSTMASFLEFARGYLNAIAEEQV